MMKPQIGYEELIGKCFSKAVLEKAKRSKVVRGFYVARLSWDVEGLPFGEQIIWILYSPKSIKEITKFLEHLRRVAQETDGKTLFIDDYDPKRSDLALEIIMLGDGHFSCNAMTLTLNDGSTGHIGWVTGQGRALDEDEALDGALHVITTNLFYNKWLKNDPFMKAGLKKQEMITKRLEELGIRTGFTKSSKR